MTEEEATEIITALHESWYRVLLLYAAKHTRSLPAAQDLVQEVFMALYVDLRSGRPIRNPRGWTITVIRRKVRQQAALMKWEASAFDPSEVLSTLSARADPGTALGGGDMGRLLSALTGREQEVLLLRLGAMKYREIADELGISMSAVNTLLARAVRKLQRARESRPLGGASALERLPKVPKDTLQ